MVEDGTDAPVAGASVLAYSFEARRALRAMSAADGSFHLPDAAQAGSSFQLVVRRGGFGSASLLCLAPEDSVLVKLQQPGSIRGRVVAADDTPIPDCRISAVRSESLPLRESLFRQILPEELGIDGTETTRADGTFEMHGLAPGSYALAADRAGFAQPDTRECEVSRGGTTDVDVRMLGTAEIRVEVFDEETGQPVDGARFEMERRRDPGLPHVALEAEQQGAGTYVLHAGFEDGHFPWTDLRVSRAGYARRVLTFAGQEGQRFRVALGRGATIDGHVWSDGKRAEGAWIVVGGQHSASGADGSFEVTGVDVARGIAYVYSDANEPLAVVPLALRNGERRTVEIGAPGTGAIEGFVAIDGAPVVEEDVHLSGASEALSWTDKAGRFRFEGLSGGRHEILVNMRGTRFLREVDLAEGQRLRLDIDARCRISGTVVGSKTGNPVTDEVLGGRGIYAKAPIGGAKMYVMARSARPGSRDVTSSHADEDGRFILWVEPGVYRLDCDFHRALAFDPPLVDVTEAAHDCVLRVMWDTIDGRVDLDVKDARTGEPLASGNWNAGGWAAGEFRDGRVSVSGLGAGRRRIRVSSQAYVTGEVEIELSVERPTAKETVVLQPSEAIRVLEIGRDSPGAQAGLTVGDTILACEGHATPSIAAFMDVFAEALGPITIEIARDGDRRTVILPAREPTLRVANTLLGR